MAQRLIKAQSIAAPPALSLAFVWSGGKKGGRERGGSVMFARRQKRGCPSYLYRGQSYTGSLAPNERCVFTANTKTVTVLFVSDFPPKVIARFQEEAFFFSFFPSGSGSHGDRSAQREEFITTAAVTRCAWIQSRKGTHETNMKTFKVWKWTNEEVYSSWISAFQSWCQAGIN